MSALRKPPVPVNLGGFLAAHIHQLIPVPGLHAEGNGGRILILMGLVREVSRGSGGRGKGIERKEGERGEREREYEREREREKERDVDPALSTGSVARLLLQVHEGDCVAEGMSVSMSVSECE